MGNLRHLHPLRLQRYLTTKAIPWRVRAGTKLRIDCKARPGQLTPGCEPGSILAAALIAVAGVATHFSGDEEAEELAACSPSALDGDLGFSPLHIWWRQEFMQ